MPTPTLTEVAQIQADHLMAFARQLDERGYALLVHHLNPEGEHYQRLAGALGNVMSNILSKTFKGGVVVHLWPVDSDKADICAGRKKLLDTNFIFTTRVPHRAGMRAMLSMIEMTAKLVVPASYGKNPQPQRVLGNGPINAVRRSDCTQLSGTGRSALSLIVAIFEMPANRVLLKGEREKCRIGK